MTGLVRFALVTDASTAQAIEALFDETEEVSPVAFARFEDQPGGWTVEALFAEPPDHEALSALLQARLGGVPEFELAPLPERDWIAESLKGLAPVAAGRFVVHGAHDRDAVPAGAIGIEVEAGPAFGTGHHATTRGCLEALTLIARTGPARRVLDLGTGTGVLAIAAAKAMRASVTATDIDPSAIGVARANFRLNGVHSMVRAIVANGANSPLIRMSAPYDIVTANILARPLMRMAGPVAAVVSRRSNTILSGLLEGQAAMVLSAWRAHGFRLVRHNRVGGWSTLILARASG